MIKCIQLFFIFAYSLISNAAYANNDKVNDQHDNNTTISRESTQDCGNSTYSGYVTAVGASGPTLGVLWFRTPDVDGTHIVASLHDAIINSKGRSVFNLALAAMSSGANAKIYCQNSQVVGISISS